MRKAGESIPTMYEPSDDCMTNGTGRTCFPDGLDTPMDTTPRGILRHPDPVP